MNKKQLIVTGVIGATVLLTSNNYASLLEITRFPTQEKSNIVDAQLKKIAIQKGIVPSDFDDNYLRKQMEVNNTIAVWVVLSREDKLKFIDTLKNSLKDEKGILVKKDSDFYVDEINRIVYDNIADGIINKNKTSSVGYAFRVVAMMTGDYDNGGNRVETLRNYIGKEMLEQFIRRCPKMYEYLIKLDEAYGK